MAEEAFKQNMVRLVTTLQADVRDVRASVADMMVTLRQHANMLGCVLRPPPAHTCMHHADNQSPCREHASSMMSRREILLDFQTRRGSYEHGGDCGLAAAEAWEFFDRVHKLMLPEVVDGVLFSPSGGAAVMKVPGTSPDMAVGISPAMKPFKRDADCIWVPDDSSSAVMNKVGAAHRVTLVTTLEGERVVVDWGIGQFSSLPEDMVLFLKTA